jgi:hypothetical protein
MKIFGRFVHLTTLPKSQSQITELCFWNPTIFSDN